MPLDISADVAYIGGVWCEGVMYGIHFVVFGIVCTIFLSKSYVKGRETTSFILLSFSTCMFILSTAHVALAVRQLLQGFVYQTSEGGPRTFFRENIFPKRKAIYIMNTLLGDSFLIWRVSVIWGKKRIICIIPALFLVGTTICGVRTIVANASSAHAGHSVFNSSIVPWVTSTFVLNIATQVTSTTLLASRIYWVSRLPGPNSQNKSFYTSLVWLIVESGALYTSAVLVQLITYLAKMNAGVILEFILAQLSAIAPALIVVRVGLRASCEERELNPEDVVLTTLHDTTPTSILSDTEKSFGNKFGPGVLADESLTERCASQSQFHCH